jgi:hypothetical protein
MLAAFLSHTMGCFPSSSEKRVVTSVMVLTAWASSSTDILVMLDSVLVVLLRIVRSLLTPRCHVGAGSDEWRGERGDATFQ